MTQQEKEMLLNAQHEIVNENRDYLTRTDYIVIRSMEVGEPVPAEVVNARAAARRAINAAEDEVVRLNELEIESIEA